MQNLVTIGSKGAWLRMREIRRFPRARLQVRTLNRQTPLMAQTKRPEAGHISYMVSIKIFETHPFLCPNF